MQEEKELQVALSYPKRKPVIISKEARRRHIYLIGKSGMGKSTTLENMIYQDICNGYGLAVIDPHGDLIEHLLAFIPSYRLNDVIYFNPQDKDYPIAFNFLSNIPLSHKSKVTSDLISIFYKLWSDSWGPRLEHYLRYASLAVLDSHQPNLLAISRMLIDEKFLYHILKQCKDPEVKFFWQEKYLPLPQRLKDEATSSLLNKLGKFLSNSLVRNIICQTKNKLDLETILNNNKILFCNLSQGALGEDVSSLLGSMLITKLQLAIMTRVNIPINKRPDFYLYIDEFQNFATKPFIKILSEARKYHLNLILAHQYTKQLDEDLKSAILGNISTLITFRIGPQDAKELVQEFKPYLQEEDLINLKQHDVYIKHLYSSGTSYYERLTSLPPLSPDLVQNRQETITKLSRERYATPRQKVEDFISKWYSFLGDK